MVLFSEIYVFSDEILIGMYIIVYGVVCGL